MKPVILSRPDRVGDVIATSACISIVRELHPEAPVILVARSVMSPVFSGDGSVDGFIAFDGVQDRDRLRAQVAELGASTIYHFHPDEVIQSVAEEVKIAKRVGFSVDGQDIGLTHSFPYMKSEGKLHESGYCRQLLVDASEVLLPEVQQMCISPDPVARERLKQKAPWLDENETCIVVNPTAARLALRWPPEKFEVLIRSLAGEGRRLVLVGHPGDDPALIYLRKKCQGFIEGFTDLGGQLDLAESAWLFEASDLHVSRDTGTSHLSAAMGCKTLVIFGRLEPEYGPIRWKPLGAHVHHVCSKATKRWWETRRQFWKRSFRSIDTEQVLKQVNQMLDS